MRAKIYTAVVLYGPKEGALKELLQSVQKILSKQLGDRFKPYPLEQIHSTLIRLDWFADELSGLAVNQRYHEVAGVARPMMLDRVLEILHSSLEPPLHIRIGGYLPGSEATFSSRGAHPYQRMFSVQGNAFVLLGWPLSTVVSGISKKPLDDLRREMGEANILHWYHESPTDIDNDFHMVVGHHAEVAPDRTVAAVEVVREHLSDHPTDIAVGSQQVTIIASDSPTLAPALFAGQITKDYSEIIELFR
ncbi:MAG TPA: hypothetical protein VHY31_06790 [Streptosporangiaceae bacterium]|nr:hypothetical protein [Streptosporangiaceae bacterium]